MILGGGVRFGLLLIFVLPFLLLQRTPKCPPASGIWNGINLIVLLHSFFFDFLPCKQSSMFFFLSFSFLLRIRNLVWNQFPVLLLSIFSFLLCEQSFFSFLLRQQIIPTHITEKVSGQDCKEEVMLSK